MSIVTLGFGSVTGTSIGTKIDPKFELELQTYTFNILKPSFSFLQKNYAVEFAMSEDSYQYFYTLEELSFEVVEHSISFDIEQPTYTFKLQKDC